MIPDPLKSAIIVAVGPTLVGIAALIKIFRVHKELNSRLTEWKEETKAATVAAVIAAYAKGKADEKTTNETKDTKP